MDEAFAGRYPFPLDDFQVSAMEALDDGRSVLVAAPTGSGKTVVAEYAIHLARGRGRKAFYTTPLKALSNQKYGDLVARYGASEVGLLTGDNSINSEAPIVVMTTEVLRNMLYERSPTLQGLAYVVMDEVHYLQDPYRGAVWEEVLIHLPASVDMVCLSATISNAEEFGEWVGSLRGPTDVVIEERRPVPLEHHYLVGPELHPMHVERDGLPQANPYLVSLEQRELKVKTYRRVDGRMQQERISRPREGHRRIYVPRREEVVEALEDAGMLPAIYFIFSRAGCDRSVRFLMNAGVRLTTDQEAERIREFTQLRAAWMADEDLSALGFDEFSEALAAGVASHHAGMLPMFKETVEELFESGLVKVVFATETLSLGINMPARTVVIEDLWKFQGERHELLTPGEYTQLTGRAGRRGIDPLGHAVVVYQPNVDFERVASLATTRTYELRSSFRPSYNMSVNLIRNYTADQAQQLLNASFAQFLADRAVSSVERELDRDRAQLANLRERMSCELGDFQEYWAMREQARAIREDAKRARDTVKTDAIKQALASLRPGDVIYIGSRAHRGLAAVVSVKDGRPTAVAQDRREKPFRLLPADFREAPEPLTRIPLPRTGRAHSPKYRRDVAAALANLKVTPPKGPPKARPTADVKRAEALERRAKEHPCHSCPDRPEHERVAVQAGRLATTVSKGERRVRNRTETLGRRFDRVLAVLDGLGYVQGFKILPKGETLARIYGEADLLVTEALSEGLFEDLDPAEVAALVSTMVFESRERYPRAAVMPTDAIKDRYEQVSRIWKRIHRVEQEHQVELCRDPDPGFAQTVHRWASGRPLAQVLAEADMTAGDFVRNCKQLVDLLRQIEEVSPNPAALSAARGAVNRGVVAYTGV